MYNDDQDNLVNVFQDGCVYTLDIGEKTTLVEVCVNECPTKKLTIPKKLDDGYNIDSIGSEMGFCCPNRCCFLKKVIIDDEISEMDDGALSLVQAMEIHWPSSCTRIPDNCFYSNSYLMRVTGTENVLQIGEQAFESSYLVDFDWPKGCSVIPARCFMNTPLETISGLDVVREVGNMAFTETPVKELDMSRAAYCNFTKGSLAFVHPDRVKFPYYITADEKSAAFSEYDERVSMLNVLLSGI